ncbi:L-lactate permease [Bounagaea algeriensis]
MQAVLAATPLVVACVLLAVGLGTVRAALVALLTAVVIAVLAFPVPAAEVSSTAGSLGPTTLEVLVILLGGVVLSDMLAGSGAQQQLAAWVRQCCADPGRAVLLVVLGITPFAESVTGFGIGVVVAVPLLRHIGMSPRKSAVLGVLGLVIVPWGALGPGTLIAAELGGVGFDALGVRSAALSGVVFGLVGAAALVVARGRRGVLTRSPDLLVVAGCLWISVWAANLVLGTALAGVLGGIVTIGAALLLSRLRDRVALRVNARTRRALRPYALLVAGLLTSSLLVRGLAGEGPWQLLASPATWLVLTCLCTPPLVDLRGAALRRAVVTGLRRWLPIASATGLFLVLGGVLTATGMSAALAEAASRLGPSYLALVPFVGGLGGFIAGSNTGANAMFAASQAQAAHALGVSGLHVLGAQNVSASLLTMASPPRVALAVSLAAAGNHLAAAAGSPEGTSERPAVTGAAATSCGDSDDPAAAAEQSDEGSADTRSPDIRSTLRPVLGADVVVLLALAALTAVFA